MSKILVRSSQRFGNQAVAQNSVQRLAQVRRHLSTTQPVEREIRDAYILSAARTPTGKVLILPTGVLYHQ